jgi:hypothetical protein
MERGVVLTQQEPTLVSWDILPVTCSFAVNPQKGYKYTCQTLAWSASWLGEGVETFERSPASELEFCLILLGKRFPKTKSYQNAMSSLHDLLE